MSLKRIPLYWIFPILIVLLFVVCTCPVFFFAGEDSVIFQYIMEYGYLAIVAVALVYAGLMVVWAFQLAGELKIPKLNHGEQNSNKDSLQ